MLRNNTLYRVQNSQADSKFDESAAIGLLQHLDKEVLEELNSSEEKMQGLLAEQMKVFEQDKEMLIASNKSLAEYNLQKQPKLSQGRELLAVEYERVARLKEEYDTLISTLASSSQMQSLDVAHALLQTKAAESEEQTDKLSEDFLDKKVDCDSFLELYVEQRTQTHLLKIKSEKLGEMIRQNVQTESAPTTGPARPAATAGSTGFHRPAPAVQYPQYGNMSMPAPYMPPVSN